MVQPHSKWQSQISNPVPKTLPRPVWLSLFKWWPWKLLLAVEGLSEITLILCVVHSWAHEMLLLFVLTPFCQSLSGGRAQLSEEMGPVRLKGDGHCYWPDPIPGAWKSSSSSPRPPPPFPPLLPTPVSQGVDFAQEVRVIFSGSWAERGVVDTGPSCSVCPQWPQRMHFINKPLPGKGWLLHWEGQVVL